MKAHYIMNDGGKLYLFHMTFIGLWMASDLKLILCHLFRLRGQGVPVRVMKHT